MTPVGRRAAVALFLSALVILFVWPPGGGLPDAAVVLLLIAAIGVVTFGFGRRQPAAATPTTTPTPLAGQPAGEAVVAARPSAPGQSPAAVVALEWVGPPSSRAHVPQEYTLTACNRGDHPAQQVVVQVRPCPASVIRATDPPARVVDGVQMFELGTLAVNEARPLKLTIVAATTEVGAHIECQAWVTFTGSAAIKFRVCQPLLTATLDAPQTAPVGANVTIRASVKNVGDCPAEQAGVQLLRSSVPVGDVRPVPTLAPGQEHHFDYPITVGEAGTQFWVAYATLPPPGDAEAPGYLPGAQKAAFTRACEAAATTRVVSAALKLTFNGPKELMVGRPGKFAVRVENVGTADIAAVTLDLPTPAGWQPLGAPVPPRSTLAHLLPGEGRDLDFSATPTAMTAAVWAADASAEGCPPSRAECRTAVTGVSALRMELIDTVDPVESGAETAYEIRVTNTGTIADTNVMVECPIPTQMRLVSAAGPVGYRAMPLNGCTVIRFDPVATLAPQAEAVYRITVQAIAAGDVRFHAQLTSADLTRPVVKEESTRVYGD